MAFGQYSRIDNRRSSSYCSTATIVVFVALCLVGVWMMTSSTVVPVDMSSQETKSDVKQQVSETNSKQFEDTPGDLPEDAIQEDTHPNEKGFPEQSNSESSEGQNIPEKTVENSKDNIQGSDVVKDNEDRKDESDDTSKTDTYKDENGNTNGGETNKDDGDMNTGGQEDDQQKSIEQSSTETATTEQEKNMENSDETTSNEQEKSREQNSDGTANDRQNSSSEQNSDENANSEQEKDVKQNSKETANDEQRQSDNANKSEQEGKSDGDAVQDEKGQDQLEEKSKQNQDKEAEQNSSKNNTGNQPKDEGLKEVFPDGAQAELLNETNTQNGSFATQSAKSMNEKEVQVSSSSEDQLSAFNWKLCNVTAGADYIPCLDNEKAIKKLLSTKHYEHRERHCPEEGPTCLVRLPDGYKQPIKWPKSRDKIWYFNVPHTKLAVVKGHQNWVKVSGDYLTFPGGGTQFKNGALHYIDSIQEALPDIAWGKRSRVVLDVGCGVASFGGYLFDRDVLTMSFAPKDEHEAQVQFALERGIPAISAVMGTKRLPFPSNVFDIIHCARCRVPWHIEGGKLLLELNRLLRPGGYFVWSATPVYQEIPEDVEIWKAMSALTKSMCWDMVTKTKDSLNQVGIAIYKKPSNNECYEKRAESAPPLCQKSDDPNAAWNISFQACMHRLPVDSAVRGSQWPEQWPLRLEKTPYWLGNSQVGVYGKPASKDFEADYEHWKHVVNNSYLNGMGIKWSTVRNVMDMRAVYGGFAAALRDMKVWVMNVVSIDSPDTLPIIYERGLFGMYHNWCESFSTYPRTYDLLHADHLFSRLRKRCKLLSVMAEVDRILRPGGKLIVRDNGETISEVENMAKSLHWEIRLTYSKEKEGLLCVQKTMWRPQEVEASI